MAFVGGGGSRWSDIARVVDQAPWKTPDQLLAERNTDAVHDPVHGQTLPVFMGTAPVEGIVFWRDGPRIETTTTVTKTKVPVTSWGSYETGYFAGGGETITTTEVMTQTFVSFAVAHSFNQFQRPGELLKVELNDVVVYDAIDGTAQENDIIMRVYDGIDNDFDPAMLAKDGEALTPAYHGLRYLFFEDVDLAQFDGAIPASIRILWGDVASESPMHETIPLLATTAAGYEQDFPLLCYDRHLNVFYNYYVKDSDLTDIWVGVTDFDAGEETSLSPVSGKPDASFQGLHGACAIPGTEMFICTALNDPYTTNWDALINAQTGAILATEAKADTEEVQWWAALASPGASGNYIAAGRITMSSAGGSSVFAFALVNTSSPSITFLEYGTGQAAGINSRLTPGSADGTGTVFYMSTGGTGGSLYEVRFTTEAAPAYSLIYSVGGSEHIDKVYYDPGTGSVLLSVDTGSAFRVRRINPAGGAVVWDVSAGAAYPGPELVPGGGSWSSDILSNIATHRLKPGYALLRHGGALYLLDVSDGSVLQVNGDAEGWVYALEENQWVGAESTAGLDVIHYDQITSTATIGRQVSLHDELVTFSKYDDNRGGLLTDIQVTTVGGLENIFNGGVIIDTDTDLRELASRLAELYGVVKVETATGVKWVKKATDGDYVPDVVLTEADLAEEPRGDAVVKIATRHRNPKEIPAEIEVRYISSDAEYQPLPARAAWPQGVFDTALSVLKRSLSVPVVITDQQALELAWGLLARERAADRTHSIKLRPHRLKLEPSDVFELTAGGQEIVGQVTKQTKLPDHSLEITAEGYLSRAATTVAAETPIVHVIPPVRFETLHVFLDGPLLSPGHDSAGGHLVGYSVVTGLEGWIGGAIYRQLAGETFWTKVGEYAGAQPVVGVLTAPLGASPLPFETDTENDLTFQVVRGNSGEITAQTEAQFDAATIVIAVGAPGRWNMVTYRNVTDNGDGTITLDTLRQGLKGTEVHEGTSETGDHVVLVNLNQAMRISYDLADLGQSVELKAVAYGQHPNAVSAQSFTVSGTAETPYAPTNLSAAVNGADIDLDWDRRTRLAGWPDDGDAAAGPMGEAVELYKVEILDELGGSVLRTYDDVPTSSLTYPEADILADFGVAASEVSGAFRVQQWSAAVGWGYAAEAPIPSVGTITADTDLYTADTDELTADH